MDLPVDTLKTHAYGVKMPHVDKKQVLNATEKSGSPMQRYYPRSIRGNIDEWAALIKIQTETAEKQAQKQLILKKAQMRQYKDELTAKAFDEKMVLRRKAAEQVLRDKEDVTKKVQEHQKEEAQKKQESLQKYQQFKRECEEILEDRARQRFKERNVDLVAEKRDLDLQIRKELDEEARARRKALEHMQTLQDAYWDQIENLRTQKTLERLEGQTGPTTIEELGNDYQRQMQKQRYQEQRLQRHYNQINNLLTSPTKQETAALLFEKQQTGPGVLNKGNNDDFKKAVVQQLTRKNLKQQIESNKALGESKRQKLYDGHIVEEVMANQERNKVADELLKRMKQEDQNNYKKMLDEQVTLKRSINLNGNMSYQEKKMNKADLRGFKDYDNNEYYSMIPGFSSSPSLKKKGGPARHSMSKSVVIEPILKNTVKPSVKELFTQVNDRYVNGRRSQMTLNAIHKVENQRLKKIGTLSTNKLNYYGDTLDQVRPHLEGNLIEEYQQADFKKLADYRTQLLPQGAMVGERVHKAFSKLNNQDDSKKVNSRIKVEFTPASFRKPSHRSYTNISSYRGIASATAAGSVEKSFSKIPQERLNVLRKQKADTISVASRKSNMSNFDQIAALVEQGQKIKAAGVNDPIFKKNGIYDQLEQQAKMQASKRAA